MNIEGIPEGVLLTTGHAADAVGMNNQSNTGYNYYLPGNKALSLLAGENTYDALVLYVEPKLRDSAQRLSKCKPFTSLIR